MEPHTAVGFQGLEAFSAHHHFPFTGLVLGTAHPAKFLEVMPKSLASKVQSPEYLTKVLLLKKNKTPMQADFQLLKAWLLKYK